MAQSEDEQPTLFMVSASVLSIFLKSDSKSIEAINDCAAPVRGRQLGVAEALAGELIQLKEERVFA